MVELARMRNVLSEQPLTAAEWYNQRLQVEIIQLIEAFLLDTRDRRSVLDIAPWLEPAGDREKRLEDEAREKSKARRRAVLEVEG